MDFLNNCGIYKITNKINGHCYIGKSIDLKERLQEHFRIPFRDNQDYKKEYPLYRAIKKYGKENFDIIILEYLTKEDYIKKGSDREKY